MFTRDFPESLYHWRVIEIVHLVSFAIRIFPVVVSDNWKLIEYSLPNYRATQLFDLDADPRETANLAACPTHCEKLAEMRAKLFDSRDRSGDLTHRHGKTYWSHWQG